MQHLPTLPAPSTAFRLHVAPGHATAHAGWLQARSAALAALDAGKAAVLLGPPGSGKSLLLQDLTVALRRHHDVTCLPRGDLVHGAPASGILLVDEADGLEADVLASLRDGPQPFVLAALPGFETRLAGPGRTVVPVPMVPLAPVDVARLVTDRLDAAGQPRGSVEPDAVLALARLSGGVPRLVLVLAGSASFLAQCDGSPAVSSHHVEEAAALRAELDAEPVRVPEPLSEPAPGSASVPILASLAAPPSAPVPVPIAAPASVPGLASIAAPASAPASAPMAVPVGTPVPGARPRRRGLVGGTLLAGLGLVLAGGWALHAQTGPVPDGPRVADVAELPAAELPAAELPAAPDAPAPSQPDPAPAGPGVQAGTQAGAQPAKAAPAPALPAAGVVLFQGPIFNETMNQAGHLTLLLRPQDAPGTVTARFSASAGLSGSGELSGRLSGGRLDLSGQLMMGRNPYLCDLSGALANGRLTGTASFVRRGSTGGAAHSRFSLTRS